MSFEQVFDGDLSATEIEQWLGQFKPDERPLIERLLLAFRYYSLRRVNEALRRLYRAILAESGVAPEKLRFIPVGYVAKSGSVVAYYFRKQNQLKENAFLSSLHVGILEHDESLVPVLLDDFIGSGHQSREVVNELRNAAPGISNRIIFAALVGIESGVAELREEQDLLPIVADTIRVGDLPFAESAMVFADSTERLRALELVENYGARLYPQYPLGYAHTKGLVGFFYSTPNNTLPIFWSSENNWSPLLPHGESFRDPSYLFGPPAGLASHLIARGPERPLIETAELDKYDIPEEIAVKLFGEFHQPQIFLVLAPILKHLGVTSNAFAGLLSAISKLRHFEHEQHPVRSALIIGREASDLSEFGEPLGHAAAGLTLANLEELTSLCQLIDGYAGAVVATTGGNLQGVIRYAAEEENDDGFLPEKYHRAASATRGSGGLLFLFLGSGRALVFYEGLRLLSYRNASWHLQRPDFRRGLAVLARQHQIPIKTVQQAMRIALSMADAGKGALLTVGDHIDVLKFSDPPKTEHVALVPMSVLNSPNEMLEGLMAQDGATVIAGDGVIVQGMTFLRPPAGIAAQEEVGRGSKHSTAAKISAATRALTVAVSVDGRVTLYSKGLVKLKVMG